MVELGFDPAIFDLCVYVFMCVCWVAVDGIAEKAMLCAQLLKGGFKPDSPEWMGNRKSNPLLSG